ncbi:MAG TPA: site-2 protease family protein [Chloroflexi bacterium]|nr:site-2 protease family protein [Chloroflexota bacterium]
MTVSSITVGNHSDNVLARYRGQLHKDSVEAYDQLTASLKPYNITPLFREDEDQHLIVLLEGVLDPAPSNPVLNLVLFVLTLISVLFAGTLYSYEGPVPEDGLEMILVLLRNLDQGFAFGASILGILLAHEFGHYLAARYHKTAVTLPYFIPFPLSLLGTMGAFIQLKAPPKNKRILHDIGLAGPLAGLVVAIPVLLVGLALSPVEMIDPVIPQGSAFILEGNSVFYLFAKYVIHGQLLPAPQSYEGLSPLLYWVRYIFTGHPLPLGGQDVMMHPMAWAGWAGLLVTALNLIPAGQLDGGHALYVLFGSKARRLLPVILISLTLLGMVWSGWWLWVALIFFLGQRHAEPLDQITRLDSRRKAIAILSLLIFLLIFTPIPLQQVVGG